jgi:hypothetical protein
VSLLDVFQMKGFAGILAVWFLGLCLAAAIPPAATNSLVAKLVPSSAMLTMGGIVTTPERRASPLFTGSGLPQPPRQKSSWTPPASNLPTNYVTAAALLFEQGLADPRACEYREIEVGTGDVWRGDGGVVRTHGWVLPQHKSQPFAICWNGLVYPAVSVGTHADLEADVMMQVTNGYISWRTALPEALNVQPVALSGIHGCLLLRLGKTDWAKACWLAQESRSLEARNDLMRHISQTNTIASSNESKLPAADPYLTWAGDWAWSLFDRMICAHERGDEKLALADARRLAAVQPLIEAACAQRGFKHQHYWDSRRAKELQPYLTFLEQLPQLLADLERRDREPPHVSVITTGLTNLPDQSRRITALIHDLDLVCAHQWGQPGGVNLGGYPIVAALINEGDAAVEPLLDCLEHDRRLTRSVAFGRDFHRGRTVIAVNSAADVALKTILRAGFSSIAEMRAYWNKYKHLKIEDRWYAILNDDNARSRWQEAAANIVQPVNIAYFPGSFSTEKPAPTNRPVALWGDCLRAKTNPSVTELLVRHALAVPTNNYGAYDLAFNCQLAEYLARWDAQAALPVAQTLSRRACTVMKYSGQQLGNYVTQLALARARAGDPMAFDDYAAWIVTTVPEQFDRSNPECLEPFRKFPTNAVLQAAAEKLFAGTNSPWGVMPWKFKWGGFAIETDLISVPAFRTLLCRELQKTNLCGTITLQRPGYVGYTMTNQTGSFGVTLPAECVATNGTSVSIRWCDWVALALANEKRIAPFDPFTTGENRDREIQSAITLLQRKGE